MFIPRVEGKLLNISVSVDARSTIFGIHTTRALEYKDLLANIKNLISSGDIRGENTNDHMQWIRKW